MGFKLPRISNICELPCCPSVVILFILLQVHFSTFLVALSKREGWKFLYFSTRFWYHSSGKNSKKLALLLMSSCQMSGSHSWVNSFYLAYRQIIAYDQSVISPASKWAKGSVGQEAGIKDRLCFQECPWSTIDIPMPWRIYSHSEATGQLFQPYSWNFPGAQAKRKRPHLFE